MRHGDFPPKNTSDRLHQWILAPMPFDEALLVDPGVLGEPGVIGPAGSAAGAAIKYRPAPKALAIDPDAGRDRAPGLRASDHDHTHVSLPWMFVVSFCENVSFGENSWRSLK
jgi:hypothetical protein